VANRIPIERITELVKTPSVSSVRPELDMPNRAVVDVLAGWLEHEGFAVEILPVSADGAKANLIATKGRGPGGLVLSGHTDTVPFDAGKWSSDPFRATERGGSLFGLGTSDMKGGLAVMIELARWLDATGTELEVDLALLFFGREELAMEESPLPGLFDRVPWLSQAGLVIMLEPTDNALHAGCMGNINADLVFHGESAHSARPWTGVNAIAVAVEGLGAITRLEPEPVEIAGLRFVEALSVTGIAGGIARNVIPDRVECHLNFRYSPLRSPAEAAARLEELVGGAGELTIESNSPSARVVTDTPLVRRLREAGALEVLPKQAWTPVAEFSLRGLDAVNFGPGWTRYAHRRDERVSAVELGRCFETLRRFVTGGR
jgi:succinyl-diaminopimelate desuccinylase